jgi:hypothetical protein
VKQLEFWALFLPWNLVCFGHLQLHRERTKKNKKKKTIIWLQV